VERQVRKRRRWSDWVGNTVSVRCRLRFVLRCTRLNIIIIIIIIIIISAAAAAAAASLSGDRKRKCAENYHK